ncbi:MAG: VWA domain-containing protein, partial [Polyangiaceae bacterium]|nr:VWA domain-containing protein [Polyangiaceae bacterium]
MRKLSIVASAVAVLLGVGAYAVGCGSSGDANENFDVDGGDADTDTGLGGGGTSSGGDPSGGKGGEVEAGHEADTSEAADGESGGGAGGDGPGGSGGVGGKPPGPDADFGYDAPEYEAGGDACVHIEAKADLIPLDIYFMMDVSTSMSSPAGTGSSGDCNALYPFTTPTVNSKWCKAINGVAGYVSSPEAKGNRTAIGYFSHFTATTCDDNAYKTPMVPLGLLLGDYSGHAKTLVEASGGLNWAYPKGNTPTSSALRGLTQFTAANKSEGRVIIGIMVTDGAPSSVCPPYSSADLRKLAQDNYNVHGIHTF